MKNIKLLAFDIDGTLIPRTRETISENTKKAIRECEKKGIKVIISTGRCSYLIQKDALESIDSDYVITINGALITDGKLSTIKKSEMSKETFNHIIDEAIKFFEDTVHNAGLSLDEIDFFDWREQSKLLSDDVDDQEIIDALEVWLPSVYKEIVGSDIDLPY